MAKKKRAQASPLIQTNLYEEKAISKSQFATAIWSWRTLWASLKGTPGGEQLWALTVDAPLQWGVEFLDGQGLSYISKAAKSILLKLGVPESDFKKTLDIYKVRDAYDKMLLNNTIKGSKTKKLVREHMTPQKVVKELIKDPSVPAEEIMARCKIAIITKEEDDRLKKAGYVQSRPNGVMYCYRDCGIDLIELR